MGSIRTRAALAASIGNATQRDAIARASLHMLPHWQLGDTTAGGNSFFAQDAAVELDARADGGAAVPIEVRFRFQSKRLIHRPPTPPRAPPPRGR